MFTFFIYLQFSTFLSGNLSFFEHRAGYRTRGSSIGADPTIDPVRSNPAIVQFRQKATHFIASLSKVSTSPDSTIDPARFNPAIVQFKQKAIHYIAAPSRASISTK